MEKGGYDAYLVKVNSTGRLLTRNRHHLKPIIVHNGLERRPGFFPLQREQQEEKDEERGGGGGYGEEAGNNKEQEHQQEPGQEQQEEENGNKTERDKAAVQQPTASQTGNPPAPETPQQLTTREE